MRLVFTVFKKVTIKNVLAFPPTNYGCTKYICLNYVCINSGCNDNSSADSGCTDFLGCTYYGSTNYGSTSAAMHQVISDVALVVFGEMLEVFVQLAKSCLTMSMIRLMDG